MIGKFAIQKSTCNYAIQPCNQYPVIPHSAQNTAWMLMQATDHSICKFLQFAGIKWGDWQNHMFVQCTLECIYPGNLNLKVEYNSKNMWHLRFHYLIKISPQFLQQYNLHISNSVTQNVSTKGQRSESTEIQLLLNFYHQNHQHWQQNKHIGSWTTCWHGNLLTIQLTKGLTCRQRSQLANWQLTELNNHGSLMTIWSVNCYMH